MAARKKSVSAGGLTMPSWKEVRPDAAVHTIGGIKRDYERMFWEAEFYIQHEVSDKSLATNFIKYAAQTFSKTDAKKLKHLADWNFMTVGKWAYIVMKGGVLDDERAARVEQEYQNLLAKAEKAIAAQEQEASEEEKPVAKVVSIQDRMREQVIPVCTEFDTVLDQFIDGEVKNFNNFDAYKMLKSTNVTVKPAHAKLIRREYEAGYAEAKEVVAWKDEDIKEAYSYMTAVQRKQYLIFFDKVLTACDTIINEGKAVRKPRKRKAPSREKIVEKVKYKESEPSLGLASIPVTNILDATTLVVYNTKNRKLGIYRAEQSQVFSVRGTTLVGFDTATSVQKTVRKPEVLKGAGKLARTKVEKLYKELKTTETQMNGRLNEHTILIRAF